MFVKKNVNHDHTTTSEVGGERPSINTSIHKDETPAA
jgi:hypothetical protein